MPRIAAASIDEHVRRQTLRITQAARTVFARQGYRQTDMADIASEVGLARNSLYRYFRNKDYILLACIEADMAPHLAALELLPAQIPEATARVAAWVEAQFDLATGPAHVTMEFMAEVRDGGADLQRRIGELHAAPNRVLQAALREMPARRRDARLYAAMIGNMVLAATREAIGKDAVLQTEIKQELTRAVTCLLNTQSEEVTP